MKENQMPLLHQLFSARLIKRFGVANTGLSEIRVLDLGCGRGDQIAYMNGLGFQMSGCDINRNFVEATLVALKGKDGTTPDVRLSRTVTELPFESEQFHGVYANGVFEHCAEMPPLIAEISRVLIPNGIFLGAFPLRSVVVEPHLRLPFVHWLAKGRSQRLMIRMMSRLFRPPMNCQNIERYLQNDVFYWTLSQVQQILHRHFEEISNLAKEYLVVAENQKQNNPLLRMALTATKAPYISTLFAYIVSRQWTYIVEASKPIKAKSV